MSANRPLFRHLLRPLRALAIASLLAASAAGTLAACGDEEETGCAAEGTQVTGIRGVVMPPEGCDNPLPSPTISARSGAGATLTIQGDARGEFSIPDAADGNWHLSAVKGPFASGVVAISVSGGKSKYVVLRAQQ